ncbi:MAG: histone deacetylase [Solirubrobacteraceae bacterium]|nr:histone deacetylase [Solirubrobacteraceae bacterium]
MPAAVQPAVLLTHPSSLAHDTGIHPERAERLRAIDRELAARGGLGWERRASPAAASEALLRVHPASHLAAIEQIAASGGGNIDADTYVSEGSWEAALHAAGGAVEVVDLLLGGGARVAASAHRPPGHHCETGRAMGFCLLSNVAIAARHAVRAHGLERVMVVDWDVHHGNGTQQVLEDDPTVLFASIHQSPLYPGTGAASEVGTAEGAGFTVNLPVPAGSGDAAFVSLVEHTLVPLAHVYEPQLILISAGYDAHADDPLANCTVTDAGFASMASSLGAVGQELGAPIGVALEGGYDVDALARSFADTLSVLGGTEAPQAPVLPEHALSVAARARLGEFWPSLS